MDTLDHIRALDRVQEVRRAADCIDSAFALARGHIGSNALNGFILAPGGVLHLNAAPCSALDRRRAVHWRSAGQRLVHCIQTVRLMARAALDACIAMADSASDCIFLADSGLIEHSVQHTGLTECILMRRAR